jgi:hypothetical protein
MNWLVWAARLWADYYNYEKKARAMRDLKQTVVGVGLALLGFLLGFSTLGLLLLSSFFFFAERTQFSLAALWTALICLALTLVVGFIGVRFFRRSSEV